MLAEQLKQLHKKLSIEEDALTGVAVLVLPEKFNESEAIDESRDTPDGISLAKHLKASGIACKTAYDFGVRTKIIERQGVDVWLSSIWIIENFAAPVFVGVLTAWLLSRHQNNESTRIHVELKLQKEKNTSTIKFDGSMPDFLMLLSGLRGSELQQIESDDARK